MTNQKGKWEEELKETCVLTDSEASRVAYFIRQNFVHKDEVGELIEATKEFIQWFDYISAYQQENLNKSLKETSKNWDSMITPSPDITKMRQALEKFHDKPKG